MIACAKCHEAVNGEHTCNANRVAWLAQEDAGRGAVPGSRWTQPPLIPGFARIGSRDVPAQELVDEMRRDPDALPFNTRFHIGADQVLDFDTVYGCGRCGATWDTGKHVCDEKDAAEMKVYREELRRRLDRAFCAPAHDADAQQGAVHLRQCVRCDDAHVVAPRYVCDDCMRDEHAVRAQMREHGQPSAVAAARGVAPMLCVDDPCGDDVADG